MARKSSVARVDATAALENEGLASARLRVCPLSKARQLLGQ